MLWIKLEKKYMEVILEKENNDYFREWIIEELKHHNIVYSIYQLK